MKRIKTYLLTIGLLSQTVFAQNFDRAKLDSYFDALDVNGKFMGSVSVSQNGQIIYAKSTGFSDIENNVRANENSRYRIGSISKTFTSVLVLKAVEMKKLYLNQTIEKFFPTIPNASKITVRHLLNHRSGIYNFTSGENYLTWHTQAKTEKEMVEIIASRESEFEPDSKAQYSNSNFVLLTYILEKTLKKSYSELLTIYIAKPLGLTDTYLDSKSNEAKSYNFYEGWKPEKKTDISIPSGAGGIVSTPKDIVKFSDALFGGKLLKNESLELMKTLKDNIGIGLFQMPFYEKTGYGHTGGIDGFTSVFVHFADGNISYAMTSNGTDFNNNDITIAVLSAVYGKPYEIPVFKMMYNVKPEDLDQYAGIYSSEQIPLKITVTKNDKILTAQATGQPSFPLEATEKHKFKFDKAGVILEFNPTENTMLLKQGGEQFTFKKE
ncbi:MAG: beta-lactamase family protein [Prevotellaceae bacterium]|jgi:CubicO group peptidase (beta-lactamase class C family)|nr:beta-lactamase family protein [Prevotellaceae bacterium]